MITSFLVGLALSWNSLFAPDPVVGVVPTVLKVQQGGTGVASFNAGECLKGNGTGPITTGACATGGGGGSGTVATSSQETNTYIPFWTSTNGTPALLSGGNSGFTFNTASTRLTVTNASTTNFSTSYASSTSAFFGSLSVGSLSGVLKATAGLVSTATNGTDYTLIAATTCGGTDKVSAISASGVITCTADVSGSGASAYDFATTSNIAVPQVAYFTKVAGITTVGSVATGTISSANSALTVTGSRYTLGGASVFTIATTGTNMFTGTPGQILSWGTGTGWTGVATSTFTSPLVYTGATNAVTCPTCLVGNQTITLSGAVTGSGATAITTAFGTMAQGVLANPASAATIPTPVATSTLYLGTGGQLLGFSGGQIIGISTTTAGTGLTYNAGSPGNFSVNTSQNIATLSNLTTNGIVYTSGAAGTLNVAAFSANTIPYVNGAGTALIYTATSSLNLAALTATDSTLTFSGSYNGNTARTVGLNLTNANTWTALQQFSLSTSTQLSALRAYFGATATTTIDTAGNVVIPSTATLTNTGKTDGCATWATGVLNSTGTACGGSGSTPGGSDTQLQFNDGSTFGGASATAYDKNYGALGLGTTTPKWMLTLSSSTRPQLALTDGSLTSNPWTFRSVNGNLYLATSSPSTFATSSIPLLTITSNGNVGIGTSTPWGNLSILATNPVYISPLFSISTSSSIYGRILNIFATTTTLVNVNPNAITDSGTRVSIGDYANNGFGNSLDQLTVDGRINNTGWLTASCDIVGLAATYSTPAGGFTCGGFYFGRDTSGSIGAPATNLGVPSLRISAAAGNGGAGMFLGSTNAYIGIGSSTPVMQVNIKPFQQNSATTSAIYIGMTNTVSSGTTYEVAPTNGCYFVASSTRANWAAVCGTASVYTVIDTGVASSTSVTGASGFRKMRIETSATIVRFYIQNDQSSSLLKVAEISTNIPTTGLSLGVYYAQTTATGSSGIEFYGLRAWIRDILAQQ